MPEDAKAMIDGDDYDVATASEGNPFRVRSSTRAELPCASVEPDHNRPATAVSDRRRPNVKH